ncbi:hypothetical protein AB0B15_03060 [Streptomyces sp. NPDC045456]|uniref:hypothetical protein n=1 Tax=Streptomyces sp. NPDC045456 TaxID=3155254 RepID=UPI0033C3820C
MFDHGEITQPLRGTRYRDEVGVLGDEAEIRDWLIQVYGARPDLFERGEQDQIKTLIRLEKAAQKKGAKKGRLAASLIELWKTLRPHLDAQDNWEETSADEVRAGLREVLASDPMRLSEEERRLVISLPEEGALDPKAMVAWGRMQASRQEVEQPS